MLPIIFIVAGAVGYKAAADKEFRNKVVTGVANVVKGTSEFYRELKTQLNKNKEG